MAINLLPWREQKAKQERIHYFLQFVLGFFLIFSLELSVYFLCQYFGNKYQLLNDTLEQKLLKTKSNHQPNLKQNYENLTQKIALFNQIKLHKLQFWQFYQILQNNLTETIRLQQLTWSSSQIRLIGITHDADVITQFIRKSEDNHFISEIKLIKISKSDSNDFQFELQFFLRSDSDVQ